MKKHEALFLFGSLACFACASERVDLHDETEQLFLQAWEKKQRVLGKDHPETMRSMDSLAYVYVSHGRYDEAWQLHTEALDKKRKILGDEHQHVLISMNDMAWMVLASTPEEQRDSERALKLALQVNDLTKYEDPWYLDTLALAYSTTGDMARAIKTLTKALERLSGGPAYRAEMETRLAKYEAALD